jgi:hypothetical protein
MIKIFFMLMIFLTLWGAAPSKSQMITHSALSDTVPVNNITRGMVDSIYKFIVSQSDVIEFEDCNICKSRAHITARAIEKYYTGVTLGKAWLFADCKRQSQREKYRYKPEIYLENTGICNRWGYHVAPILTTPTDTFVIDPATQKSAVTLSTWANKLIPKHGEAFLVIKDKRYFIFPDDENGMFEDEKSIWYDSNENLLDESFSRSIDEVVRASLGLAEPWKMRSRIVKIKKLLDID